MKSWNLLLFDEVVPNVLSSVGKESSVSAQCAPRRRKLRRSGVIAEAAGTIVFVAAMTLTSLQVQVSGSDDALRLSSVVSTSNIHIDRPPLALFFGAAHPLKWDAAKEDEMLSKAAAAVAAAGGTKNRENVIHAVLREGLPSDREEAADLSKLGMKLG